QGTGALVDALASHLKGSILRRMAVSSLGEWNGRFTLCMENGLMLEAGALIVAAPARHVERMFRTLQPEISQRLFEYPYDSIMRVALGVRADEYKSPGRRAWDMAVAYFYETDHPDRTPPDHRLIHLGVRLKPEQTTTEALLALLKERFRLPEISASLVAHWPDADSLAVRERAALASTLNGLLPEGIALVGSDYVAGGLAERVEQGREAARQIAAWAQSAG
ncbi:MAG: FAD-dependent oxidoreductase, partial [Anaerolineae bacterium]|nr:FAD-dependent oxidoreductase [Anaerolineae bacterium]